MIAHAYGLHDLLIPLQSDETVARRPKIMADLLEATLGPLTALATQQESRSGSQALSVSF